jgi:ELWxxDGT repeat protein
MVKDIYSGYIDSFPENLLEVGNTLIFVAESSNTIGRELWKSDGTEAGTMMFLDTAKGYHDGAGVLGNDVHLAAAFGKAYYSGWFRDGVNSAGDSGFELCAVNAVTIITYS